MKNFILLILFSFCISSVYSQKWETVKVDTAVSFKLPKGYKKGKSGPDNTFTASTSFGTILIFKTVDDPIVTPDIEKEKHLNNYYDDYIKRVKSSSSDAIITNEKDTLLGELKVKDFTLQVDSGSGIQYRKFRILHANSSTYTFEFLYEDINKQYADSESQIFFNSIEVSDDMNRSDQFTDESREKEANYLPYVLGASGLLALGILIYIFSKKRKSRQPN